MNGPRPLLRPWQPFSHAVTLNGYEKNRRIILCKLVLLRIEQLPDLIVNGLLWDGLRTNTFYWSERCLDDPHIP